MTDATEVLGGYGELLSIDMMVPLSPHVARVASLEAEVARLLAANAVLQRGAEIIAAADTAATSTFPARALAFGAQRIGLLTIFS